MINVFLADDHAVVCDGMRALMDAESDIRVVGTAGDGRQAAGEDRYVLGDIGPGYPRQ